MSFRLNIQCPHGFLLHVPVERLHLVDRRVGEFDWRRGIEVDPKVCKYHDAQDPDAPPAPSWLMVWRSKRRMRRALRKL